MNDTSRHEENLDALLKEWNAELNEWHAQIALFKAATDMASIHEKGKYIQLPNRAGWLVRMKPQTFQSL